MFDSDDLWFLWFTVYCNGIWFLRFVILAICDSSGLWFLWFVILGFYDRALASILTAKYYAYICPQLSIQYDKISIRQIFANWVIPKNVGVSQKMELKPKTWTLILGKAPFSSLTWKSYIFHWASLWTTCFTNETCFFCSTCEPPSQKGLNSIHLFKS